MSAAIVVRGVVERRRSIVGYGVGLGLMVLWVMSLYPSMESELVDYVDAMPESLKSLFGFEDVSTLASFVHAELMTIMGPLVFLALGISIGAATIAGEEQERVLPLVLATGVGRRNLVRSKLTALVVDIGMLAMITFASILVGLIPAGGGISIAGAAAASVQLGALGVLFGTLALAAGAATGHKGTAVTIAIGSALVTYLADAVANMVDWLEPIENISPFHWYAPTNPLVDGIPIGGLAFLLATTIVLAVLAVVAFDRRDIGV